MRFPRGTDNPRDLPELRAALVDFAAPGDIWEQIQQLQRGRKSSEL